MDNLKFVLFSIFVLLLLGLAGFWAFRTLESGSDHVYNEDVKDLKKTNETLEKQIASLARENELLKSNNTDSQDSGTGGSDSDSNSSGKNNTSSSTTTTSTSNTSGTTKTTTPSTTKATTTTTKPATTTTYKYQDLINELQKLVDKNISLKLKSQGATVGTVQKFLNIYKANSVKVDNDYGTTTVNAVKNFQKAQGLTANGEVGSSTLKKMISWLKTKK